MTTLGQTHQLGDLTQVHTWIIERRVRREDKISRDGRAWQTLGSMPELAPFFHIVDSAERARALAVPSAPLVPLQPPILTQPARLAEARAPEAPTVAALNSASVAGAATGDSLGSLPQAADIGDTEMIRSEPAGSHRFLKLAAMVAIAAGVGYAGIIWQKHHLRPAVISSPGTTEEQSGPSPARVPPPAVPAATAGQAEEAVNADESGRGPVVEPLGAASPGQGPQSLAAQGYVALGHRQYQQAIVLFKRELAQSPINGTAIFGLAEAYRGAGQKQQALQTYRRYVDILPFGPDVGSARFHIRTLEARLKR